jgi:hypothetical protein
LLFYHGLAQCAGLKSGKSRHLPWYGNRVPGCKPMKLQDSYDLSARESRHQNGRREQKGLSVGIAFLGAVCVVGVFALLAVLFHAG